VRTATTLGVWRDGELVSRVDGQHTQEEEGGGGRSMRMATCSAGRSVKACSELRGRVKWHKRQLRRAAASSVAALLVWRRGAR
jgi:hypothetical protein